MMHQLTMQDVTYQDYPIQYFSSPSTGIDEIDEYIWDSVLSNWIRERPKRQFCHSLMPLLETDLSSIRPHFEIKNEIAPRVPERENIFAFISEITNKLIEEEKTFKGLDKKKIENFLRTIKKSIPSKQLETLSDEELVTRVKKALEIELMCGLLNDLNEKQIMNFESAIKRRDLFE